MKRRPRTKPPYLDDLVADAAGTVYVAIPARPRNALKQLICWMREEGTPRCFQLPDAVAARA